jgi:GNAT superfamily N-acetyltransferase
MEFDELFGALGRKVAPDVATEGPLDPNVVIDRLGRKGIERLNQPRPTAQPRPATRKSSSAPTFGAEDEIVSEADLPQQPTATFGQEDEIAVDVNGVPLPQARPAGAPYPYVPPAETEDATYRPGLDPRPYAVDLGKGAVEGAKNMAASALKGVAAAQSIGPAAEERAGLGAAIDRVMAGEDPATAVENVRANPPSLEKVTDTPGWKAGEAIEEFGKKALESGRPYPGQQLTRDVGGGFGSVATGVGVSLLSPTAAGLMFVTTGQGEAADRAVKAGATPEQIQRAARFGTIAGATDVVDALLPALGSAGHVVGFVKRVGYAAVAGALAEGGQEGLQQFIQNAIAKGVYKPDQDLAEDVPYNMLVGAIVGGTVSGGTSAAQGRGPANLGIPTPEGTPTDPQADMQGRPSPLEGEVLPPEPRAESGTGPAPETVDATPSASGPARPGLPAPEDPLAGIQTQGGGGGMAVPGAGRDGPMANPDPEFGSPPADPNPASGPDRERAILRAYGYTDQQITDMSAAQRAAEVKDAEESGVSADQAMADLVSMFGQEDEVVEGGAPTQEEVNPAPGTKAAPVKVETEADLDAAASNVHETPTAAQKEAENYKMGHVRWPGIGEISIETRKGSTRTAADGSWQVPNFPAHYGRIKGTVGADGQQIDAFMGGHPNATTAYVINQNDPKTGKFDEHKIMLGFADQASAQAAYDAAFSDGSGPSRRAAVVPVGIPELKAWFKDGKTKKAFPVPKVQGTKERQPKGALSLLQYLAWKGGIRQDSDLRSMDLPRNIVVPGVGYKSLIRGAGMTRDQMLEAAREGGYLPPAPADRPDDVGVYRQLLDMIDEESRGRKAMPMGSEGPDPQADAARIAEENAAHRDRIMAAFAEAGVPVETVSEADIAEAERIMREEGLEPDDAFERAVMRNVRVEESLSQEELDTIYGEEWWDAVQAEPALQDVTEPTGESSRDDEPGGESPAIEESGELSGAREDGREEAEGGESLDAQEPAGPEQSAEPAEVGQQDVAFGQDDEIVEATEAEQHAASKAMEAALDKIEEAVEADDRKAVMAAGREARKVLAGTPQSIKDADPEYWGQFSKAIAGMMKPGYVTGKQQVEAEAKANSEPTTEQTEAGEQTVIPGAEKISDAELAQKKAEEGLKPKVEQKEPGGLFGDDSKQTDLLDEIGKKKETKADADEARESGPSDSEADVSTGEIETVTKAEPEVDETKEKLQDAGEKIGGARKDQWAGKLDTHDLDDMTGAERDRNVTKQNVWPRLDYGSLVEDEGVEPLTAALIKRIYDRLPAKYHIPRYSGWDEQTAQINFIRALNAAREAFKGAKTTQDLRNAAEKAAADVAEFDQRGGGLNLLRALSPVKAKYSTSNPLEYTRMDTRAAEKMVNEGFPNIEPWQRFFYVADDTHWSSEERKYVKVGYKVVRKGSGPINKESYKTEAEAKAAAKAAYENLDKSEEGGKEPTRPHLDQLDRAGPDYRKDRDVTGDDFVKDFGFRGVEFGNWVAGDERQKVVNLAYDAMHDLARILNLSPKALSLDGKLALGFGSRGRGGKAAAHYEPDRVVINMTKLSGAGSLAHEWAHAVDHYLGELGSGRDYKGAVQSITGWDDKRKKYEGPIGTLTPRLSRATNDLMNALFYQRESEEAKKERIAKTVERMESSLDYWMKTAAEARKKGRPSRKAEDQVRIWTDHIRREKGNLQTRTVDIENDYYKEAKKLSGKQGEKGYWARPTEMFARAFESWVFDKIFAEGNTSQYLVQGVEADRFKDGAYKGNPYPAGEDRTRINDAFDRWAKSLATTDGKHGADTKLVGERREEWTTPEVHQVWTTPVLEDVTPQKKIEQLEQEMQALDEATTATENRDLSDAFTGYFRDGKAFPTIIAARKFAKEAGHDVDVKELEEAIELGVVKLAREIAAAGENPQDVYKALVNLYSLQPRLGTRTSTSVREQAYSTPVPLAYLASRLAGIRPDDRVFEPTAGNGALLMEVAPGNGVVNEINATRRKNLETQGFKPSSKDASDKGLATGINNVFTGVDVVVANPPFGAVREGGESKVFDLSDIQPGYQTHEIDHAIALRSLAAMHGKGGRAVLILGGVNKMVKGDARSDGYNGKAKREFYKVLYDRYNVTDHFTVAGELYERQGAGWPVDVIVIDGRGKSARKLPAADVPRQYSSWDELGGLLNDTVAGAGAVRSGVGEALDERASGGSRDRNVSGGEPVGGQRDSDRQSPEGLGAGVREGAVPEQPERGADGEAGDGAGRGDRAGEPGGADLGAAAERSSSGLDDFDAIFDAALDETFGAVDTEAERGRANAAKDGPDSTRRRGGSQAERDAYDAAKRSTADVAKSAVSNAVDSADAAMAGLVQLFGGGKTVGEGLSFDEATYAKAKPLFIQAAAKFSAFKNDVAELVRRMVGEMQRSFGLTREGLEKMRPYIKRFLQDVTAGAISLEPKQAPETAKPEAKKTPNNKEAETATQVAYKPQSRGFALGTLVPVNMRRSVEEALQSLADRVGDLDTFVANELGYGANAFSASFAAEQVDALALAIDNIKEGKGFIIGDQTGIGKGRVNAAIIRWAIKNGHVPVFVTEKPNLYGDMYRDLTDTDISGLLDRDVKILMTNGGETVPLNDDGSKVLRTGAKHNDVLRAIKSPEAFKKDYDVVFTTYNQMQSIASKETPRRDFLRAMAPHAVLIFDESHNAGGQAQERKKKTDAEGRAQLARTLIGQARGVFYSSATYAKRPDVMDLYSKTDMALAVEKPSDLGEAIARGGVPMQQVVAAMLSQGGQYIRRERSFAGVTYDTPVVAVSREQYDGIAKALAAIQDFSAFMPGITEKIDEQLKAEAEGVVKDGSTGTAGAESINFTAIMHNVINQVLMALKAKPAVEVAIEALRRGEKPVFTVAGTMESFLSDYADNLGLKMEDVIEADFSDVLLKYLDRTRTITIQKPFSKEKEKKYLTDEELGRIALGEYRRAKETIAALDLSDLPISPIDHIKGELNKAGYEIGEITGRSMVIDYSEAKPILRSRPGKEKSIAGRRAAIRDFNSGKLNAMIINQAGATGLSLHASRDFADQKKRHMIIVQPEANIDIHMQMLGRIHRTGQVVLPTYSQLIADVPAEKRPAAVLAKKMASLNANTTASRGGALTAKDVPDFINEYGDLVAVAYLADHPEVNPRLAFPVKMKENGGFDPEDAMRKLTGRIPLLPLKQQEEVYSVLEAEYNALIEQMNAAGENALEAQTFDLKAKTLETTEVVPAKEGSTSPFAAPVNVEKVSIARLGKPFKPEEVVRRVAEELGDSKMAQAETVPVERLFDELNRARGGRVLAGTWQELQFQQAQERQKDALGRFGDYRRSIVDEIGEADKAEKERVKLDAVRDRWQTIHETLLTGRRLTLKTASGNLTGVVLKVEQKGNPKNPLALSTWKATFAIADATRQITIPFSRLWEDGKADSEDMLAIEVAELPHWIESPKQTLERFEMMQSEAREERYIATGNLLAAYDWLNRKGAIINYTDDTGTIRQGVLTSRQFDLGEHAVKKGRVLRDPAEVKAWLDNNVNQTIWAKGNVVRIRKSPPDYYGKQTYNITAEKKKSTGGRYYLDKSLTSITGDFYSGGGGMNAEVDQGRIIPAIAKMQELGAEFTVTGDKPKPTKPGEVQQSVRFNAVTVRPEFVARRADLASMLNNIVKTVGGPNVNVAFADFIPADQSDAAWGNLASQVQTAAGQYVDAHSLVVLSIGHAQDTVASTTTTAYHEAWHHVESKLLTPEEQRVLNAEDARLRQIVKQAFGFDDDMLASISSSEIRPMAFEAYVQQRERSSMPAGMHVAIRRAFERLMHLFRQIWNALRGMGIRTTEDIFQQAYQGDIGRRGATEKRTLADVMADMEPEAVQRAAETEDRPVIEPFAEGSNVTTISVADGAGTTAIRLSGDHVSVGMTTVSQDKRGQGLAVKLYEEAARFAAERGLPLRSSDTVSASAARVYDGLRRRGYGVKLHPGARKLKDGAYVADSSRGYVFEVNMPAGSQQNLRRDPLDVQSGRTGAPPAPESIQDKLRARNLPKLAAISRSVGIGKLRPAEIRTQVQDKFVRVKNLQKAQQRETGPIPERMDTYTAESLYYGRTGEQIERLDREHIDPLITEIKRRNLSLEQVDDYLMAKHAPERNARIREINPDIENPAGMSDEEAAAILARASGQQADFDEIERRVRALIDQTNQTRLRGGLISEETLETWETTYSHYVPLRGFAENIEEEESQFHTGGGMDVRGPESRRALGRESRADGPLAYVILQAQEAIVRAEKDRVGRTFLRYVQANPNPSLWTINTPERKRVVSPITGMVVEIVDPAWVHKDNVFAVKVGGRPQYITFHGKEGKDLARAFKNLGAAQLHPIIRFFSGITRILARMSTAWNPDFFLPNFLRDAGEAFVNLQAQDQKRFVRLFAKYLIPSIGGAFQGQRGRFEGRFSRAFEEFDRAGGRIRFFGLEDPDDIAANVSRKLRRLEGGFTNNAIAAGEAALEGLELVSGSIENATRLAAFMAAREVGLTPAQSAKVARELTVNFNRKGELGSMISAAYMFANASIQGTVRTAQAMKHPNVRRAAYGLAAFGALLAFYNFGAGGDDEDGIPFYEKIPQWDRDKNFIFMWPKGWGKKGAYSKIPLPYGYLPFHIIGARLTALFMGKTTKDKALGAILKSTLDTFDPIGRDENAVAQFTPTVLRPGVHLYTNENWTGRPISPPNKKKGQPDSENYYQSASKFSIEAAKKMNSMSGGNAFTPGKVDVSPGTIDYMLNFLGGGVGRFVAGSVATPWRLYQGEDAKPEKMPLARRFYGFKQPESDAAIYYENREDARNRAAPARLAEQAQKKGLGTPEGVEAIKNNARFKDNENIFNRADAEIRKRRDEVLRVRNNAKMTEAQRKARIDEINNEIMEIRNRARRDYRNRLQSQQ